jgi:hypothetical protein
MCKFPNLVGTSNIYSKIHPLKQKTLLHLLKMMPTSVDSVFVFGSAVTFSCWNESDLDLLVIGDLIESQQCGIYNLLHKYPEDKGSVDVLFDTWEGYYDNAYKINHVYHDIATKGVLVYKAGKIL